MKGSKKGFRFGWVVSWDDGGLKRWNWINHQESMVHYLLSHYNVLSFLSFSSSCERTQDRYLLQPSCSHWERSNIVAICENWTHDLLASTKLMALVSMTNNQLNSFVKSMLRRASLRGEIRGSSRQRSREYPTRGVVSPSDDLSFPGIKWGWVPSYIECFPLLCSYFCVTLQIL